MIKVLIGDVRTGRLMRLQYLGYSLLLSLLMFGFGLAIVLAIGAGGLDVAVAMGGGPFYLTCPRLIGVELTGRLQPWVSSKDIILRLLSILTTKGNVGWIVEYFGPGVASISATVSNSASGL